MLPPRGGKVFSFVHELFLILSSKRSLSDGKEEEGRCTSASPPLVREGDHEVVEGVNTARNFA